MNNDLVSIIVPIFNAQEYLDKCINSVLNQTYKNIELLLIDDGSTDNSLKICKKYEKNDKRIKVIHKKNTGVSDTRNKGIIESKGKYILFLDSDDYFSIDALETMMKYEVSDDKIIIFALNEIYENKDIKVMYKKNKVGIYNINNFWKMISKCFDSYILNVPWNKIYSRKILVDNNLKFRNDIDLGEDLLFNIDYFRYIKNIQIQNDIIYNYRVTQSSLSRKKRNLDYFYKNDEQIFLSMSEALKNVKNSKKIINKYVVYRVYYTSSCIFESDYTQLEKIYSIDQEIKIARKFLSLFNFCGIRSLYKLLLIYRGGKKYYNYFNCKKNR